MLGNISIWQLLIVLGIIILIFGTKKLRNIGSDLGGAVKGFKKAVTDGEKGDEGHGLDAEKDKPTLEKTSEDAQFTENVSTEAKSKTTQDKEPS